MSILPSGSSQQLFLISLPDKFPLGQARDQLFVQSRNRGPLLNHYVWNMHTLADYCASFSRYPVSDSKIIQNDDSGWKLLLIDGTFTNNQGDKGIKSTDTFNPLTAFTHYENNDFISTVSFPFSPLISYGGTNDITDASLIIYKAMILPSYPLMITSTIPYNEHYGPLFPFSFNIGVNDSQKSVKIDVKLSGGKSIFSYPKPQVNLIEKFTPQSEEIGFIPYRKSNIFDCEIDFKTYGNKEQFLSSMKIRNQQTDPLNIRRITSMNLQIDSNYDFRTVAVNNSRVIFQGPRYATLTKRTVTGSITYASNSASFNIPVSSELTMYFGDIFYFPMQNVDWQKPVISLEAGNIYLHTFSFIARVVDGAVTNSYRNQGYCSEFLVDIR